GVHVAGNRQGDRGLFEEAVRLAVGGQEGGHPGTQFLVLPGQLGQAALPLLRGDLGDQFDEDRTGSVDGHGTSTSASSPPRAPNAADSSGKKGGSFTTGTRPGRCRAARAGWPWRRPSGRRRSSGGGPSSRPPARPTG